MPEQQKERDLRQAFIQHLPERLSSIESDWRQLTQQAWDRRRAETLYQKIQGLMGASGQCGLVNLSESALSLELLLKIQINDNTTPTEGRIKTAETLLTTLRHEGELVRGHSGMTDGKAKLIYLLDVTDDLVPGLVSLLHEHQYRVIDFSHPDDLESEIQRRLPDVLVISGKMLNRMALLNRELAVQQELHKQQVGILCLSRNRGLEQRLLALRSGVDVYLTTPVNSRELLEKIARLGAPKAAHYRILIVEDDPSQGAFAASILKKSGMQTHTITDPMRVLDALNQFRPDLVLMDLYMPGADGIELTAIIREHPDFITTPIVFLSGEQDTDKQLQALSVGGDDFLSKPIRPQHLVNTIRNRVQRARSLARQLHSPSTRDPESGLYTQRHFYQQLEEIITRPQDGAVHGALLHIHLQTPAESLPNRLRAGFLANLGSVVSELTEEQDIAARLDENSFAILLLRPHQKTILFLARQLVQRLRGIESGDRYSPVIGIATFNNALYNAADLVANATQASRTTQAQEQQIVLHVAADGNGTLRIDPGQLPGMLEEALQKNSLQCLYSSLHARDNQDGEIHEMRVRMLLPERRQIDNAELLTMATEQALGIKLSQWLINRALTTLDAKRAAGRQSLLFVSQASDSIFQGGVGDWLRDQLRSRQMVGSGLVLEYRITELGSDLKTARQHFARLHGMDIKVSLSRFAATAAALKALNYLGADFVRLAGPVLKADSRETGILQQAIHSAGAKSVLPGMREPGSTSPAWRETADLVPAASLNNDLSE